MTEASQTNKTVMRILRKAGLDPHRVENLCEAGMPDIEFHGGWVENKLIPGWPKRESTQVRIDHYTQDQKNWLLRRWRAGGAAWLLVQCGREFLLFDAPGAQLVGGLTEKEMKMICYIWWKPINEVQFVGIMKNGRKNLPYDSVYERVRHEKLLKRELCK